MKHVMLDFETMGLNDRAAVVALGAVQFSPTLGIIEDTFYARIELESAMAAGLVVDPGTILWWLKQSEAARAELFDRELERYPLNLALVAFSNWLSPDEDEELPMHPDTLEVWASSRKDFTWLDSAYAAVGMKNPVDYRSERCFRTLRQEFAHVQCEYGGTAHNAIDDATNQALHLAAINRYRAAQAEALEPFFTKDELDAYNATVSYHAAESANDEGLAALMAARKKRLGL